MTTLPLDPHAAGMALHLSLLERGRDGFRTEDALDALALYLEDVGNIRHFTAREVVQIRTHRGVRNTVPTPMKWQNIVRTLHVCEWVRQAFGNTPVHVHSGYRSSEYNRAVGGAQNSLHRAFNALDISINGVGPQDIADRLEQHTESHLFGIGIYRTFCHLDTRGVLGMDRARWDMRPGKAA